jgi:hypothetical protein
MSEYRVWCPERGQNSSDARRIEAFDAEEAAELWAERDDRNSAEYSIVAGEDVVVCVRCPDGKVSRWRVSGESVPNYIAREAPDE